MKEEIKVALASSALVIVLVALLVIGWGMQTLAGGLL